MIISLMIILEDGFKKEIKMGKINRCTRTENVRYEFSREDILEALSSYFNVDLPHKECTIHLNDYSALIVRYQNPIKD